MDRQEAIQTLSKVGKISVSYAEDLYDSFFPKPVVPQYVADWYEENKGDFEVNFWAVLIDWNRRERKQSFNEWFDKTDNSIQTIVNMHQFGYDVEEEKRYTVKIKAVLGQYLGRYYLNNETLTPQFSRTHFIGNEERPTFTRKELESNGFGWVFSCPGVEVKEVE